MGFFGRIALLIRYPVFVQQLHGHRLPRLVHICWTTDSSHSFVNSPRYDDMKDGQGVTVDVIGRLQIVKFMV